MDSGRHGEIAVVKRINADCCTVAEHSAQRVVHQGGQAVFANLRETDFSSLCVQRTAYSLLHWYNLAILHQRPFHR
ncbi:hypothetical protein SDC9_182230 [bioreactor metagenome]|uniref:Uncharacterized protein n=1 Tax=bioreactor metagenome TaxID=1076179 RepID=A0A645H8A7_9ZZZZ